MFSLKPNSLPNTKTKSTKTKPRVLSVSRQPIYNITNRVSTPLDSTQKLDLKPAFPNESNGFNKIEEGKLENWQTGKGKSEDVGGETWE